MLQNEIVPDRETALRMLLGEPAESDAHHLRKSRVEPEPVVIPKPVKPASQRGQPCRCGRCKACLDNARWDRVFNEKFADDTYYIGMRLLHRSPLAGL